MDHLSPLSSSASPSRRDVAPPLAALLLTLLALPATGWAVAAWLPQTPAGYEDLALLLTLVLVLGLGGGVRGLRSLGVLLAVSPCLVFAALEAGGAGPSPGWWLAIACAVLLARLPAGRGRAVGAVAAVLGGGLVLGRADLPILPAPWNALASPVATAAPGRDRGEAAAGDRGLRVGAALPVPTGVAPALGEGPGPWWSEAAREQRPGPRPVVLVLGGAAGAKGGAWVTPAATIVPGTEHTFSHAHELRCFDAVLALGEAWDAADPAARDKADAVAGFVRKGGLLIGPAPPRTWPPHLGPRLHAAGRGQAVGVAGVRRLGLGRVARAGRQADVAELLAADLWVREAGSPLLDPQTRPGRPAAWQGWSDRPAGRRTQGLLLGLLALALVGLTRLLRGRGPQWLGALLVAATVSGGLAWTSPADPGIRVEGVALDLGGPGGRRIEAVWIDAGPRGYLGRVRWTGTGVVGLRGARLTPAGDVSIAPDRSAWIVRETEGLGVRADVPEDRAAGALRSLLTGAIDPRRLRFGRLERLPVRVEGWGPVAAGEVIFTPPTD